MNLTPWASMHLALEIARWRMEEEEEHVTATPAARVAKQRHEEPRKVEARNTS